MSGNGSGKGITDIIPIGKILARPVIPPARKNKVRPLKRLSIKQRRMIALHCQGYNADEIAADVGCKPGLVNAVIYNPTSKLLIDDALKQHEERLQTLIPLGIEAIRAGLTWPDPRIKLAAVDRLFRSLGKYRDNPEGDTTAEDVIRRVLKIRHGDVEVTVGEERR